MQEHAGVQEFCGELTVWSECMCGQVKFGLRTKRVERHEMAGNVTGEQ